MISIKLPTTAQTAYGFAMPMSGATFLGTGLGMASGVAVCAAPTTGDAIRDRHVAPAFRTQGAVPGPTAWSPPIC